MIVVDVTVLLVIEVVVEVIGPEVSDLVVGAVGTVDVALLVILVVVELFLLIAGTSLIGGIPTSIGCIREVIVPEVVVEELGRVVVSAVVVFLLGSPSSFGTAK